MSRIVLAAFSFLVFSSFLGIGVAEAADGPKIGDKAPDFSLPAATRDSILKANVELSKVVGHKNIILAFYPADWSGGCTTEMCTMRDDFSSLSSLGADVYGISGDYVFSHHEWAKAQNLPFTLLSDHDHSVAKEYHSYNPKSGHDLRTIYVVDRSGKIAYVDPAFVAGSQDSFNKLKAALKSLNS